MAKKIKKQERITMTARNLDKIKMQVCEEAVKKSTLLMLGYLMDDLNYDGEKIIEILLGIERYSDAINEHYITLAKIEKIINEKTGLEFRW